MGVAHLNPHMYMHERKANIHQKGKKQQKLQDKF